MHTLRSWRFWLGMPVLAVIAAAAYLGVTTMNDNHARARQAEEARFREEMKITWEGSCPVVGQLSTWLRAKCGDREISIRDEAVILSYQLNPGPVNCKLRGDGPWFPVCDQRLFKMAGQ